IPLVGGFFIAGLASFLGVGGGFLLVPFLTSVTGLPMYLVAGTSAFAVLIGMITSIFSYMVIKGTPVYWPLIGVELLGILAGSVIGTRISKYFPEIWLKRIFVVLALYVGVRYVTKGFLGYSILPPF
ncbi:MAG: sulfite exporter TauE/SafE family protein, partial [Thermodesulfovibrionia bacterium]